MHWRHSRRPGPRRACEMRSAYGAATKSTCSYGGVPVRATHHHVARWRPLHVRRGAPAAHLSDARHERPVLRDDYRDVDDATADECVNNASGLDRSERQPENREK